MTDPKLQHEDLGKVAFTVGEIILPPSGELLKMTASASYFCSVKGSLLLKWAFEEDMAVTDNKREVR